MLHGLLAFHNCFTERNAVRKLYTSLRSFSNLELRSSQFSSPLQQKAYIEDISKCNAIRHRACPKPSVVDIRRRCPQRKVYRKHWTTRGYIRPYQAFRCRFCIARSPRNCRRSGSHVNRCCIALPLLITLAPTSGAMSQKLRRIDWVGNVLFTLSMTSFLVPVTWGGVQVPWSSWRTIIPLVLGAVGTVGFCLYERCVAKEPILRLHLFRSFNMAFSFIAIFFHGASMYVSMYFLPLYFEAIHGYTPLTAGLAFLPSSIIIVPAAIAAGIVVPKRVNFRVALVFGWLVSTTSYGCCLLLKADSIPAVWVALSVSTSLGLGITMSSISLLNQAAARNTDVGFAVSAFSFFRYLGQCFGVSLAGTIFQNIMRTHLPTALMSSSDTVMWTKDAISLVRTMKTIPNEPTRLAVQDAFGWGLFSIWAFICGLNGFALIGSIFIGNM
ncbi:Major facilitator superfamily [Macrophomina phaseolina MS6]|uniref:Major facilitator superfamily n=1 Tax=Macrophomina phaseolina (strain MS6) TaxID=1126212 RepID=K2R824_MACPH|nr:Major facilitator superfamily [Macrophomina phaseolina MS6]